MTRDLNDVQNVIFNFENIWKTKIFILPDLNRFSSTGKCVSSQLLVETSYSDGFHVLFIP